MQKLTAASVADMKKFFHKELRFLLNRNGVSANQESVAYICDLMIRFVDTEKFFVRDSQGKLKENFLVDLYAEYINGTPERRKIALQRLGDVCLVVSGFFSDSLNRKVVDIDYYFGMGGSAYWHLSNLHLNAIAHSLYKELAIKFKSFANILGEMSERSGIQNNQDLLRLYEKWLITGSDRLRKQLSEHGIAGPIKFDFKQPN